jgi:hypothetical protein
MPDLQQPSASASGTASNRSAHASRLLVWLLVVGSLLVDMAVVAWSRVSGASGPTTELLLVPLVFSQIGLLSVWAVLGRPALPWRLLSLVCHSAFCGVFVSQTVSSTQRDVVTRVIVLCVFVAVVVLLATGVARWFGLRARWCFEDVRQPPRQRLQFTIRYLFAWLTATAIALGVLKSLVNWQEVPGFFQQRSFWSFFGVLGAVQVLLVLGSVVAVLHEGILFVRLLVLAAGGFGAFLLVKSLAWGPAGEFTVFVELVLLIVSLAVIRVAGYRVGRASCIPAVPTEMHSP